MRASHEWLREFVPHALPPAEVERLISTHVATVDSVESRRADLAAIVIGRVVQAGPHPDSDHLWVTKVDDGSGTLLDVVCGAPVVTVGTLYPFARSGTVMPNGMKIERRKIRGEVSNGMLCSARELGLGEDHAGIMALDIDAAPGTKFLDAVPVGDVCYEIDVLPNRPDLLSHIGMARELAALSGVAMRMPTELAGVTSSAIAACDSSSGRAGGVAITLEDAKGCPRYGAAIIRGVKVGPSPAWLRARVEAVGSRSISNVVDITNYFLHGYGQPMHAFDLSKLGGSAIVVRRARAGEKLTTLDGVDRSLTPDMLVIADASKAVAVAGVMGGRDSEVTDATTDILLEVASFDAKIVRGGRRALGLNTDASHRFERGTDPALPSQITALAAELIASVCGGKVEAVAVVGRAAPPRKAVAVRPVKMSRLLGAQVDGAEISKLLTSIGFKVDNGSETLSVTAPSWRHDVSRDVDLLEEIARLRGYNTLSDELSPFRPSAAPDASLYAVSQRVRDALVAAGFAETRPLPFVRGDDATHIRVTNPLADDEPHLRTRLLDTLAKRAEYNLSRRVGDLRLFEVGSVFIPDEASVGEQCHVGVLVMGAAEPPHFKTSARVIDAWDAKAIAADIARAIAPGAAISFEAGEGATLWTVLADGAALGTVGTVALDAPPWAAPAFGVEMMVGRLPINAVAAPGEHQYESGVATKSQPSVQYKALPSMPPAEFDLAFVVPDTIPMSRIETSLKQAAGELLERVVLFDEFRGPGVPDGHRSLAWRLTFRHPERTLNEKEIAARRQKLIATVEKEHGVAARTG